MLSYLHWQFAAGPRWLLGTLWNLELALLRFFSVGLLLRTLFAPWHRDLAPYTHRTFTEFFLVFALNLISRAVGAVVRSLVLSVWLITQAIYVVLAAGFFVVCIAAPFLILAAAIVGLMYV